MIRAKTPGKLILSGEHAVVHGAPAIAIAVSRYFNAELSNTEKDGLLLEARQLNFQQHYSWADLKALQQHLNKQYQRFIKERIAVTEIISHPVEILAYAAAQAIESHSNGVQLSYHSDIPISCGMGSSASAIVSTYSALMTLQQKTVSADTAFTACLRAENLCHGHSSGIDISIAQQGGGIFYQAGHSETRHYTLPGFYLVNTGKPESSTGECVSVSTQKLNSQLLAQFSEVTLRMDTTLQQQKIADFMQAVRDNHQLLCQVGVVPEYVKNIVTKIEARGGAAKICGAGSVSGDAAGMLLVCIDEDINDLLAETQWSIEQTGLVNEGSQCQQQ